MDRTFSVRALLTLAGLIFSLSPTVDAQTEATTGVIAGTVRDPAGAVLPRSTVKVRHVVEVDL